MMGLNVCLLITIFCSSCNQQSTRPLSTDDANESQTIPPEGQSSPGREGSYKNYSIGDGVRCGYLTKEGMLWFGTNTEGVYRYDGESFTNFTEENGLCNNKVISILEDKEGNMWFGAGDGLCMYDGRAFTHLPIPWTDTSGIWLDSVYPIVNPNQVMSMVQDQEGNLWLGTNGGGAYRFDGKSFTSFLKNEGRIQSDGLHHNIIHSMLEDKSGNIWFTSLIHGGVSRYDGTTFTHFMPKDGLSDDMYRCSFQDKAGNIWFGSNGNRNGGLDRYDPTALESGAKPFTSFHKSNDGIDCNNIMSIYEDKAGNLWVGSGMGNLCIFDGQTFREFSSSAGQKFERITFILGDDSGNIWFGGAWGQLFRYDGKTVTDFTQKGR